MQSASFGRNSEMMSSILAAAVSFFSKPNNSSWHLYDRRGVSRGARGHNSPSAESLRGVSNDCGGAKKFKQCHKYFLQYSTFAS